MPGDSFKKKSLASGLKYTEGVSKIGILSRRLLKIFRLEEATIAYGKAQVKTKILMQSRRSEKPILNRFRYTLYPALLALLQEDL